MLFVAGIGTLSPEIVVAQSQCYPNVDVVERSVTKFGVAKS